jgi:hypothetical protein
VAWKADITRFHNVMTSYGTDTNGVKFHWVSSTSNIWGIFLYPMNNNGNFKMADFISCETIFFKPVGLPIWAQY